jgi:GntR family transcriptional regulator
LDILISHADNRPIYEQIMVQIKQQILSGRLKIGEALPSMRLLAKELRISVITTKRAYDELERAGFIESFVGKGTFVACKQAGLLREEHLRLTEEYLLKAIEEAKIADLSEEELIELLHTLFKGDE